MRKRALTLWLSGALAAAAMAAAVTAPAEVLDNLDFFSDFEMLVNLEILEDEKPETGLKDMPAAPAVSTAAASVGISTGTVKLSTTTRGAL